MEGWVDLDALITPGPGVEPSRQKLNTTHKRQTTQTRAKQNYPGLVASYDTQPGNDVGLFYNTPEPTGDNFEQHFPGSYDGLLCRIKNYRRVMAVDNYLLLLFIITQNVFY